MSRLTEMFNELEPKMRDIFAQFGQIVRPVWFCEDDEGQKGIIFTDVDDNISKDMVAEFIKKEFKERNIVRYITVMEMWYVSLTKEAYDLDDRPPSQRDNRKEGVLLSGEDKHTGEKIFTIFKIERTSGKPVLSDKGESVNTDTGKAMASGRFVDLFDNHTRH